MNERTLTYHDQRAGDIYHIHVLGRRFIHAFRHIGYVSQHPLVYDKVEEIPDGARHDIEQMLEELK